MNKSAVSWDSRGTPFSIQFNDMYFCAVNGYEDAAYIFCAGNKLEERFKALDPSVKGVFTIVETGFGTGLVFCVAWEMWRSYAPDSWVLNFVSIEKYPLTSEEIQRALNVWPYIKVLADELTAVYKVLLGQSNIFILDAGRVRLNLIIDDIVTALGLIMKEGFAIGQADAIFLDGFAPSKNPEMWTEKVFAGLACLSKPGTTLATFTVAGWVKRGLEAQGYKTQKCKGYGCKNEMLEGRYNP